MPKTSASTIGLNSIFLIIRKVITLFIAFYSTRLLLEMLGEDDFGLYGLIGSIVVLFSAIRGLFSTSIQRFINAAKGDDDKSKVNVIFSMGVKIHVWIALCFIVVVEIVGIFILPDLNIPQGSFVPAMWVLQFTIFATAVTILTIPYDAIIIANEHFKAYSIIAVVESVLKLIIIFFLIFSDLNRVVLYSALLFIVTVIVRFINSIYCHLTFGEEVKYHRVKDKALLKEMTAFAGWQFCGNLGYALANSGINLIINIFGGIIVNTARTIAYQLMNAVTQFVSDLNLSFQPRTIMAYARNDIMQFRNLIYSNSKAAFGMGILIAFPILICTQGMLKFWLGTVPPYTVQFTRWIMIYMIIRSLHGPIDLMFKSKGNLKRYQITELVTMSLNLPFSWIALKLGAPYWVAFAIMCGLEVINLIAIICLVIREVGFSFREYLSKVVIRVCLTCGVLGSLYFIVEPLCCKIEGFIPIAVTAIIAVMTTLILIATILLDKSERNIVLSLVKKN